MWVLDTYTISFKRKRTRKKEEKKNSLSGKEILASAWNPMRREGVLLVDLAEDIVVRGNAAAGRIFGRPRDSLRGTPLAALFPGPQREEHILARARANLCQAAVDANDAQDTDPINTDSDAATDGNLCQTDAKETHKDSDAGTDGNMCQGAQDAHKDSDGSDAQDTHKDLASGLDGRRRLRPRRPPRPLLAPAAAHKRQQQYQGWWWWWWT
jgi:hypothetical protein